jgi:hypothetical protein
MGNVYGLLTLASFTTVVPWFSSITQKCGHQGLDFREKPPSVTLSNAIDFWIFKALFFSNDLPERVSFARKFPVFVQDPHRTHQTRSRVCYAGTSGTGLVARSIQACGSHNIRLCTF